jgi:hypothetical protein
VWVSLIAIENDFEREIEIEQFTVLIEGGINLTESEAVEMVDLLHVMGSRLFQ